MNSKMSEENKSEVDKSLCNRVELDPDCRNVPTRNIVLPQNVRVEAEVQTRTPPQAPTSNFTNLLNFKEKLLFRS